MYYTGIKPCHAISLAFGASICVPISNQALEAIRARVKSGNSKLEIRSARLYRQFVPSKAIGKIFRNLLWVTRARFFPGENFCLRRIVDWI